MHSLVQLQTLKLTKQEEIDLRNFIITHRSNYHYTPLFLQMNDKLTIDCLSKRDVCELFQK